MNKLPVINLKGDILLSCGAHLNLSPSRHPPNNLHSRFPLISRYNHYHPPDSYTFSSFLELHFSMKSLAIVLTLHHF